MVLIIEKERRLFSNKKYNYLFITKDILKKITKDKPHTNLDVNIDKSFKIDQATFIKLGELTYIVADRKKDMFIEISLTNSNILFIKGDQYTILRFKYRKSNTKYTGAQIIKAAMKKCICLVVTLTQLFI